jgi:hypothetical protein
LIKILSVLVLRKSSTYAGADAAIAFYDAMWHTDQLRESLCLDGQGYIAAVATTSINLASLNIDRWLWTCKFWWVVFGTESLAIVSTISCQRVPAREERKRSHSLIDLEGPQIDIIDRSGLHTIFSSILYSQSW